MTDLSSFLTRYSPGYGNTALYRIEQTDVQLPTSANTVAIHLHVSGGASHGS